MIFPHNNIEDAEWVWSQIYLCSLCISVLLCFQSRLTNMQAAVGQLVFRFINFPRTFS